VAGLSESDERRKALMRGGGFGIGRGRYSPCSARNLASNCKASWRAASRSSGFGGGAGVLEAEVWARRAEPGLYSNLLRSDRSAGGWKA